MGFVKNTKQKIVSIIIHAVCIAILYILPEITMNIGDVHHDSIPTGVYVKTIIYILVYYINYFFLFDKSFNYSRPVIWYTASNLLLFTLAMGIIYITWEITAPNLPAHGELSIPPHTHDNIAINNSQVPPKFTISTVGNAALTLTRFFRDAIMLFLTITLCIAIKFSKKWSTHEHDRQAQLAAQREEELKNLKNQLNPHFLFNSLNSIYALTDICPLKAKEAIHELSHLLRYALYDSSSNVSLQQEIKFIENFIKLMKIRLGEPPWLDVTLNCNNDKGLTIAPLIFVTIVENVFKHGNTGKSSPVEISINSDNGIVHCHTFNHINSQKGSTSEGIGLSNLKRRLSLIYGNDANLSIKSTSDTFTVDLTINLKNHQNDLTL